MGLYALKLDFTFCASKGGIDGYLLNFGGIGHGDGCQLKQVLADKKE